MVEEKNSRAAINEGYQPEKRGYQPKNDVNSGYKPPKRTDQPAPPPRKP